MAKTIFLGALLLVLPSLTALAGPRNARAEFAGQININTATADELQMLSGVGPAKAQKILDYRRARAFRTIEELGRVKGIGRKMMQRLRPHLTVTGATNTAEGRSPAPDAISSAAPNPTAPPGKLAPAPARLSP